MSTQIEQLIRSNAATQQTFQRGFVSPIFLRKKSNGEHRLILNLKNLNHFVSAPRFRLPNLYNIPDHLWEKDYMIKIDLSQAYYHIPIAQAHQRYLTFEYEHRFYHMTCLPFGLASAPSAFAKITNWLAQYLRGKQIRVIVYLDDFLLMHSDPDILSHQGRFVLNFLTELGWCVNQKKSTLTPTRCVEYLGVTWDTRQNQKYLPQEKVKSFGTHISSLLEKECWNWWEAKSIAGKLNFAAEVVPLGRLHCRNIQISTRRLPQSKRRKLFPIESKALQDLVWWTKNLHKKSPIHLKPATVFITTDAADKGWGAIVNSSKLKGTWNTNEQNWHSNQKELWTLYESGWEFLPNPERKLDLLTWTRRLLEVSKERRSSKGLTNLFITTRGKTAPASRTVIAGWIRTLFKEANLTATPGTEEWTARAELYTSTPTNMKLAQVTDGATRLIEANFTPERRQNAEV
ncbi:reverse transcriptase (RNA-dependent DNA polymerase) domain-containing protein [Phthorimaea operculella]|nr:reverse transcriptase (RNA-dependent DNA polymerase) domain-containing protein [Phthorimaea operculella]